MKKNITQHILFIVILTFNIFSIEKTIAQDIHFSQFYVSPMFINPAKTGFFNGNYRLMGIYRSQWKSVTVPYKTILGSGDLSLALGKGKKDIFGIGIIASSDKAGDAQLTNNQLGFNMAYSKSLGKFSSNFLSIGFQGAHTSSFFSTENLHSAEEFLSGTSTDNFAYARTSFNDFSVGVEWNTIPDQLANYTFGLAVFHLNQPSHTFSSESFSRINRKIVFNANATLPVTKKFLIYPKFLFSRQGKLQELDFGAFTRINVSFNYLTDYGIYLGALCRWNDALIFVTRFDLKKLGLTISYDVNYSGLSRASNGFGGPEISLTYTSSIEGLKNKVIFCPRF